MLDNYLSIAANAARTAGEQVMNYFGQPGDSLAKQDGSPVTIADRISNDLIMSILSVTELPVVSEENTELHIRSEKYWLVDPLDGTKEFIAQIPEFAINIALVVDNMPILGVVFCPALKRMYIGLKGTGSWLEENGNKRELHALPIRFPPVIATSRYHEHADDLLFQANNIVKEKKTVGAALKYGMLASGDLDVYARFVGTSEWDTAAGQVILESIGGSMIDLQTKQPLIYGKKNRRNGSFIAFRSPYQLSDFKL